MTTRKLQLYINESEGKLYEFIDSIENESPMTKGYVANKIKEILRAWSGLAEIYGERDVTSLSLKIAASIHGKTTVEQPEKVGNIGTSGAFEVGTSAVPEVGTSAHKEQLKAFGNSRRKRG